MARPRRVARVLPDGHNPRSELSGRQGFFCASWADPTPARATNPVRVNIGLVQLAAGPRGARDSKVDQPHDAVQLQHVHYCRYQAAALALDDPAPAFLQLQPAGMPWIFSPAQASCCDGLLQVTVGLGSPWF
jgi:hypothetical protein